jgi:LmbE family N-acetylglucosaminyl deacetylase
LVIASDITDSLAVTLSDGRRPAVLLDRNYNTGHAFSSGASVHISSPEGIHSLYIIWAQPPGEWELHGTQTMICGKDGFIHEFIGLQHPETELTLHIPEDGASLRDIYAFSEGTPPDWVQVWQPPLAVADLLVLPTHADDEHLFFVGVLPYYAGERGLRVQVAYLTSHWHQPPRAHELLNGLWVVGVRNYPVIGDFRDRLANSLPQAITMYGWDRVVDFQVELLRRFQPLVVVGHDLNGEYRHGVHMLNAHTILAAFDMAADAAYHPDSVQRYGVWHTPKLYLHLYRENAITMDWSIPLERFGGATAFEMAVEGYARHRSQHRWSFRVPSTGPRGHLFGLAGSRVGYDIIGGDMFENIDLTRSNLPGPVSPCYSQMMIPDEFY